LGKGTFPQTGTSIKRVENAVDKTFFKSLTWAALKILCLRLGAGFWIETCSRKWPISRDDGK
jgi:hypothetical protein